MNILMMTNTYKPIIGGLEKSVEAFSKEFRRQGHHVIIVAPAYEGIKEEHDVIRIPAIQNFNGSDFSVPFAVPVLLTEALRNFKPDIVHSHHPFLIGDTALRLASKYNAPLVFTHHTLYEDNVHYVPGNEEALKRFVIELSTGYANLADHAFAPSKSVRDMMRQRGVDTPIEVVPTGVEPGKFVRGAGKSFRKRFHIPVDAFVVGHLGRLALEKNLEFLVKAVVQFLKKQPKAHFLVAGKGPFEETIRQAFSQEGVDERLHMVGVVKGREVVNCYHAMNVFAFASQSETQGLVLTEAMASGVPVAAVDAPGAREVVKDSVNGRLLAKENTEDFVAALEWAYKQSPKSLKRIKAACEETSTNFSMTNSAQQALKIYSSLFIQGFIRRSFEESPWAGSIRMIQAQWDLMKNMTKATGAMVTGANENDSKADNQDIKAQWEGNHSNRYARSG